MADNQTGTNETNGKARLRREFVSMLFALAAGQVAVFAYQVWQASVPASTTSDTSLWRVAAFFHLGLALLVIATSWVGWSRSKSADREVSGVFDRDFPAWLLDVLLVIVYFFLASSAEVKGPTADGEYLLTRPSSRQETLFVFWLLLLYLIWDISTKWWPKNEPKGQPRRPFVVWIKNTPACIVASGISTILAAALLYIGTKWIEPTPDQSSPVRTLLVDVAAACLVILFRVLKSAEVDWFEHWRLIPSHVDKELGWRVKAFFLFLGAVTFAAIACHV